jgi:hypothetical protein
MFFRVYFLIRTIMNFCAYSELYSKRVCKKYGFESNTSFCLKALIKKSPGGTILVITVISIMWLSYVLRIFERYKPIIKIYFLFYRVYYNAYNQILFDDYTTSIWCVVITMTTVGYGDVAAISPFGRIVSIINALWGAFIISLLVASINNIFELNEH